MKLGIFWYIKVAKKLVDKNIAKIFTFGKNYKLIFLSSFEYIS